MEIRTDMLITLCYILEEFEEFRKDLRTLVEKRDVNVIGTISTLARKELVIGKKDVKNFYQKYKKVIDIINRGNCHITLFLSFVISQDRLYNLDFFYNYLGEHKNELDKIVSLLKKIKSLGIEKLEFTDETFTDKVWKIDDYSCDYVNDFYFMENMVGIPSYLKNIYKSNGSHYLMKLYSINDHIKFKKIMVNSLMFDANLLPEDLSKENTYDKIMEVINSEKLVQYRSDIDDILKLDLPIDEVVKNYNTLYNNILNLKRVKGKKELKEALEELNRSIAKLKNLQVKYNEGIIKDNPLVTGEVIGKEKELFLKKINHVDWD